MRAVAGRRLAADMVAVDMAAAEVADKEVVPALQNILDFGLYSPARNHQALHCLIVYKCFLTISIMHLNLKELLAI